MTRYKLKKRICSTRYFTAFSVFHPLQDGPGRWILDAPISQSVVMETPEEQTWK